MQSQTIVHQLQNQLIKVHAFPYRIEHRLPTVPEYKYLCVPVGWGQIMNLSVAEQAIDHSVAGVVIHDESGQVIAMGRIVGDGATYFYIQDVVVFPDYQRAGLGTVVLTNLFQFIMATAPEKAFIGLFSVPTAV